MTEWQLNYMSVTLIDSFAFHFTVTKEWSNAERPGIKKRKQKYYIGETKYFHKMQQLRELQKIKIKRDIIPGLVVFEHSFVHLP